MRTPRPAARRPGNHLARPSRRQLFGLFGGLGVSGVVGGCGIDVAKDSTGDLLRSEVPLPPAFETPLPIPPVKEPTRTDGTTDYYDVVQRESTTRILPDRATPIYGYDGVFPGPTIVSRSGRRAVIRHRNELPVPVAVHLHGGHTPSEHDGYPIDLILPPGYHAESEGHSAMGDTSDEEREYVYPLEQRAATLWYHDHRMDFTGPQVYRGLAGFHLVHDDEEDALPLPQDERDIPLLIADRSFTGEGEFAYPALDPTLLERPGVESDFMEGVLGDVILVNGAAWPVLEVDAARYRFRILNASNARRYRLALDPTPESGPAFVQVGSDGGLLERPVDHETLVVAPAERFDVVVDFSAYAVGTEITLVNAFGETADTSRVMRFRVARKASDDSRVPDRLSRIERLDPASAVRTREWRFERTEEVEEHGLQGWAINGKVFDPRRMDAAPKLGDIEVWRFATDLHHPVHVHLDPFQVVGRRGRDPGDYDAGWKDTVDVTPTEYVDVVIRFGDYAGRYVMHCHNLEHEDMMMMAAFETVD